MIKTIVIYTGLILSVFLNSCKKDKNLLEQNISIRIDSIFPNEGNYRTEVLIFGNNFDQLPSSAFVTLNNKHCTILSKSNTLLKLKLPERAGSGAFQIHAGAQVFSAYTFSYHFIYATSTVAGDGTIGLRNGPGNQAQFYYLVGIVKDSKGDYFITDYYNSVVRKMDKNYNITTYAGSVFGLTEGNRTTAKFALCSGIAIDNQDNIYIGDTYNHRIRKITNDGIVSTVAGSSWGYVDDVGINAKFNQPKGIALDSKGNLYIADYNNDRVRKLMPNGRVETYAGSTKGYQDGVGTNAKFNYVNNLCVDAYNNVYVSDASNNRIRKIDTNRIVTTFAGDGTVGLQDGLLISFKFSEPKGVYIDNNQNVWVPDFGNHVLRKIIANSITTLIGSTQGFQEGENRSAKFNYPGYLLFEGDSLILMCDTYNQRIRKITIK